MRLYRGFLLDADNTIFDYDRCEREALSEVLQSIAPRVPLDQGLAAYRKINTDYWRRFELASITAEDLKHGRFADLLHALGVPGDPRAVSESYLGALSRKAYFLPHAERVVRQLAVRIPLCLVTNGLSMVQRGRLAASGLDGCFRAVLISEELGVAKPDPRFFEAAVSALALPVRELLCVGDNPVSDIAGARDCGIDTCWVSPDSAPWVGPGPGPTHRTADLRLLASFAPLVAQGARI